MRRSIPALPIFATLFVALLLPADLAWAHGSERGLVMLLPTGFTKAGSALAVAASFLLLALAPSGLMSGLARLRWTLGTIALPGRLVCSTLAFLILVGLVAIGLRGTRDPLENLLPLTIWTLFWVLMPVLASLFGNLFYWINPWSGPLILLRRATGKPYGRKPIAILPDSWGYGIAIVLFGAFAWLELISLSPDDPEQLAVIVSLYWLFTVVMMVVFGETEWVRRAEPFSVFFRLVSTLAPLRLFRIDGEPRRCRIMLDLPGRACLDQPGLPPSGLAFAVATLASVSFDGFSKTFTWFSFIGVNPLDYQGRSQVMVDNSAGLFVSFVALLALYMATIFAGCGLAGAKSGGTVIRLAGLFILSLLPISVAFHAAHYLTQLMVNGQYWWVALSDPFSMGWNLFGTAGHYVTTSFLSNLTTVNLVWMTQTSIIVSGHVVGIAIAHALSVRHFSHRLHAVLSQLVLAIGMVGYTVFGLWLLSTPTVG